MATTSDETGRDGAVAYLEKHGIREFLEGVVSGLVLYRPDDPLKHLLGCLGNVIEHQQEASGSISWQTVVENIGRDSMNKAVMLKSVQYYRPKAPKTVHKSKVLLTDDHSAPNSPRTPTDTHFIQDKDTEVSVLEKNPETNEIKGKESDVELQEANKLIELQAKSNRRKVTFSPSGSDFFDSNESFESDRKRRVRSRLARQLTRSFGKVKTKAFTEMEIRRRRVKKYWDMIRLAIRDLPDIFYKDERQSRLVQPFISSTFRDMQEERHLMVTKEFPQLERWCRRRHIEFCPRDLRWGITADESKDGKVIYKCLTEIDKCRPYFVCMLGARYGWSQVTDDRNSPDFDLLLDDTFSKAALNKKFKFVLGHKSASLTELEIMYAALNCPDGNKRAFFYFREDDSPYYDSLSEDERLYYRDTDPRLIDKMAALKAVIVERHTYGSPAWFTVKTYKYPKEVAHMIASDLQTAIDEDFPLQGVPTIMERTRMAHAAQALARSFAYVQPARLVEKLCDYAARDPRHSLYVIGDPGIGKSSLLTHWAEIHAKADPLNHVILHFIAGGGDDSRQHTAIIRRILIELKERFQLEDNVPAGNDESALISAFKTWLDVVSQRRSRLVIIVCALDRLQGSNARSLSWIPHPLPDGVQLIISTLYGHYDDLLKNIDSDVGPIWEELICDRLSDSELAEMVTKYLDAHGKNISKDQMNLILAQEQTHVPLYTKVLLNELRMFGSFECLDDLLQTMLEANNVVQIYELVLQRMGRQFGENIISAMFSYLCASKDGLTETELIELLDVPQLVFSDITTTCEDYFIKPQGRYTIFHEPMRDAVGKIFITTPAGRTRVHVKLGNYFMSKSLDDRQMSELPYQLIKSKAWQVLKEWLSQMPIFHAYLSNDLSFELLQLWNMSELGGPSEAARRYVDAMRNYWSLPDLSEPNEAAQKYIADFPKLEIPFLIPSRKNASIPQLQQQQQQYDEISEVPPSLMWQYIGKPVDTSSVILPPEVDYFTERIAENIHEVWSQTKIENNWVWSETRDDVKKEHHCLIAFLNLTDCEKEYDRDMALETLKTLLVLGWQLSLQNDEVTYNYIDLPDVPYLMKKNGYKPRPIDTRETVLPPGLMTLAEHLAENVHNVWARKRVAEGWSFGFSQDDNQHRSPSLVPFCKLDKSG